MRRSFFDRFPFLSGPKGQLQKLGTTERQASQQAKKHTAIDTAANPAKFERLWRQEKEPWGDFSFLF